METLPTGVETDPVVPRLKRGARLTGEHGRLAVAVNGTEDIDRRRIQPIARRERVDEDAILEVAAAVGVSAS